MPQRKLDLTPLDDEPKRLDLVPLDLEPDEPSIDELLADAKKSLQPAKTETTPVSKSAESKRGFYDSFSEAFEPFTEPLTDYFSRQSNKSADFIDSPRLNRSPLEAQLEGFKAGATQGAGKVLDSMTSPVNLAMELATFGKGAATKAGLKTVAKALGMGVKGLGAATAAEGVKHTIEGEGLAEKGFGLAEVAGGLAATLPAKWLNTSIVDGVRAEPEPLPVKPPYRSPIIERPYEPAELSNPNYASTIVDPELAGTIPYEQTSGAIPEFETAPKQAFDPASLQGLEPTPVVPEGVDPNTGEIIEPSARRATRRMNSPELGPTPEALPVAAEPAPTFESWLDRLKTERGILNVNEILDAVTGRPARQASESATPETPSRRVNPEKVPLTYREGWASATPDSLQEFVTRFENHPNYQTENGQNILNHARDLIDERRPQSGYQDSPVQPTTSHTGGADDFPEPTEARRYDRPMSYAERDRLYPEDLSPTTIPPNPRDWDIPAEMGERRFESGGPHPTTHEAIHDLSTEQLGEFLASTTDNSLVPYAEGVLQERTRFERELTGDRESFPARERIPFTSRYLENSRVSESRGSYLPEGKTGKSLDELEATKKKSALERLGKLIGEDRAGMLASGEAELGPQAPAMRSSKGKKLHHSTIQSWNDWGDQIVSELVPDPSKPGIHIEPHSLSDMFPNSFEVSYRSPDGVPLGSARTNMDGTGISVLAVNSKLGLGRGKIAFKILKPFFDKGIMSASGSTSDYTKNLIERVRKIYERARSEKGELNLEEIYSAINDVIDKISSSKFGQAFGRMMKDETGSSNLKDPLDALNELFEKSKKGALTPEETALAKKLAKEQSAAPAPQQTPNPKEYLEGKSQVDTGPLIPENAGVSSTTDPVLESLSKRLKKAVDEAGSPNSAAPEEISKLIDEASTVMNQLPNGPEKQGIVRQVIGANKALLTSWDVSAPGRQGKAFILNKAWWTSLDDMVKAWTSPVAAKAINDSIIEHPSGYFKRPVSETGKVGRSFADEAGLELTSTEEMFNAVLGQKFEKYSGIGKSSRAHTAFLNKLRSDQFVSMIEGAKRADLDPEKNLNLAQKYATFINDATGRGSVNIGKWKLERNLGALNDIFFAPKNMAGQIRTWNNILNPMKYVSYDPVMRKQALRSLLAVAGLGLGVGEVARLAGAQVSNDPTNSDFRKIRLGDSRIDLFGGYQQFPVAAMRFIAGQSTSSISGETTDLTEGKFGRQTRATLAERFFTNRLSPVGSFIWAWMSTREFDGKPFEAKKALYERIFPIAAKDILDLAQEDPFLAAILAPTTMMGLTGTQHYSGRN